MTSKEFYKKTSEMAYHLKISQPIANNTILGKIGMVDKCRNDAEKFLSENDFFAVSCDTSGIDLTEVSLIIEFHYGVDSWDAYAISVCDMIDCRDAGGDIVLSCDGYHLINEVRPEKKEKDAASVNKRADEGKSGAFDNIFDTFDEFFKSFKMPSFYFPSFPQFPNIADFDAISKNTAETIRKMSETNDGKTRFYDFHCKVDPDGNVTVRRSTNDGTVSREFNIHELEKKENSSKKIPVAEGSPSGNAVSDLKKVL